MRRSMCKSKIHRATVTDANLACEGSIPLDPVLMAAAARLVQPGAQLRIDPA